MPALTAGILAPEFALKSMDGRTFSLKDALQNGPVVLAFFKITCPVCQYALPYLERIHKSVKGKDATIVGISQNPNDDTALFVREYGITFPVLLDDPRGYKVSNAYGLTIVPTVFYVDMSGEIRLSSVGWAREDMDALNTMLADAVNTPVHPVFAPGEDVADFRAG